MATTIEVPELLNLVYDAALDWQAWPAALTRLADAAGGWVCGLGVHDARTQVFAGAMPRTDPLLVRSYVEHWASCDSTWQRIAQAPAGTVLRGYEYFTREEIVRSEFYNEWMMPQEIDWALGAKLLQEGSTSAMVSFYRPWRLGDFESEQIEFWRAVMPHVVRALQLQLRLAAAEATSTSSLEVLNRLDQGVLLVDAAAKVIFANRAAEAIFAESDGLRTGATGLRAATPSATTALRKVIAESAGGATGLNGFGGPIALPRAFGRRPLSGLVIPLRATTGWLHFSRPTAIVFVSDPERRHAVHKEGLQRQFGLTQSEAAFVVEILRGEGLQASADALGISVTTARTHLTHTFEKTGTRRQAELVHLILQSQPGMRDA